MGFVERTYAEMCGNDAHIAQIWIYARNAMRQRSITTIRVTFTTSTTIPYYQGIVGYTVRAVAFHSRKVLELSLYNVVYVKIIVCAKTVIKMQCMEYIGAILRHET